MSGKGDTRRPTTLTAKAWAERWAATFGALTPQARKMWIEGSWDVARRTSRKSKPTKRSR